MSRVTLTEDRIWDYLNKVYGPSISVPGTYRELSEFVGSLGESIMLHNPERIENDLGGLLLRAMCLIRVFCSHDPSMFSIMLKSLPDLPE